MQSVRSLRFARPSLLGLLFLTASMNACLDLSRGYVERYQYALEVQRSPSPDTKLAPPAAGVLGVRPFVAGPGLDGPGLVYRVAEARYESDFYHQFFVPPTDFVTTALRRWMADAALFQAVVEPGSLTEADYVIDGCVSRLLGDYRDRPEAQLQLQIFLTHFGEEGPEIAFHREYTANEPLDEKDPEELVEALRRALARILSRCESDLRTFLAEAG